MIWLFAAGCGTTPADEPCDVPGAICTWAGTPTFAGFDTDGRDRRKTLLYLPVDVTFALDGTAYYPDYNNHRIRRIDASGTVTTIAGTGFAGDGPGGPVGSCWEGCDPAAVSFDHPSDVAVDPADPSRVFVAAWHNGRVHQLDLDANTLLWFVGTGSATYSDPAVTDEDGDGIMDGDLDGDGSILDNAGLNQPSSVVVGPDGSVYLTDQGNHLIRRVTPDGGIETVAGSPGRPGYAGDGGPATEALIHCPVAAGGPGCKLALDGDRLIFADTVNQVVRAVDLTTGIIQTIGGTYTSVGTTTLTDPVTGSTFQADAGGEPADVDGPAGVGRLSEPRDVAVGPDGAIYVAQPESSCVRVIRDGEVSTFAGTCDRTSDGSYSGDGGPANEATLNGPFGVAVDGAGAVYVTDTLNQVIRRVAP